MNKEYDFLEGKIWQKKNLKKKLKDLDSLVLDIDGVILNVNESFRVAISRTVNIYLKDFAGLSFKDEVLSPEKTGLFKLAGGFNNDWELTEIAILFYLKKSVLSKSITDRGLEKFTSQIRERGGGLKQAFEIIIEKLKENKKLKLL
ncbi:MAG: hypothetical protein KAS39_05145, partial [Actinomycetia bacterium]|nr:hypothetical protein [Actinomycetes bacterium]